MPRQRVLVTGGAGFIGSRLVTLLLEDGIEPVVLDDLSSGRSDRLPEGVPLAVGDVTDGALLRRLAQGCDTIFHLAAIVSVQDCIDRWSTAHAVNLGGSIAVCEAAVALGGIPVVQASSAAVYGRPVGQIQSEADLARPISPYGADKLAAEHHAAAMAEIHGLPSIALRFFNVYGEGQDPASPYAGVIARFVANKRMGRQHALFGDGNQVRDFIHVDDVVRALLLAQRRLSSARPAAETFNICTGRPTRLTDLIRVLDTVSGNGPNAITNLPPRAGDISHSLGDPRAARAALGFEARISLDQGLARLWASSAANGSTG